MFSLLICIGILLIVLGLYKAKDKFMKLLSDNIMNNSGREEINELLLRIESLEHSLVKVNHNYPSYETVAATVHTRLAEIETVEEDDALELFKAICQCESEDYSLEETCLLLNMNKGEVILLKNLYKNFQK